MRRYLLFVVSFVFCLVSFGAANAAFIDLRPNGISMGDNGSPYHNDGSTLSVEVWIMPTDNNDYGDDSILDGWSFDILYDTTELTYVSGVDHKPSGGWFDMGKSLVDNPPYVQYIEALTFGPGLSRANPDEWQNGWLAATLNFSVHDVIQDGLPDVEVYYRPGQGLNIENQDAVVYTVKPSSIGPDVAPVPIPGAVWLLGSGILGMIASRCRVKG